VHSMQGHRELGASASMARWIYARNHFEVVLTVHQRKHIMFEKLRMDSRSGFSRACTVVGYGRSPNS
jgi:hypothetical protein